MSTLISFILKKALPFNSKLFTIISTNKNLIIIKYKITLLLSFLINTIIYNFICSLRLIIKSIFTIMPSFIKIYIINVTPLFTAIYNQAAKAKN